MLNLSVPNTVLGQEVRPLLDHLDAEPGRGHEDDTLLRLDFFARLDAGRELAGKCQIGHPGDTLAVSEQGLLVEETLNGGVLDSALLSEGLGVLGVGLILRTDKDQSVKVGRSAGLEGELGLEGDTTGRDGSLDRSDDLHKVKGIRC
jgi:hypothetical protein